MGGSSTWTIILLPETVLDETLYFFYQLHLFSGLKERPAAYWFLGPHEFLRLCIKLETKNTCFFGINSSEVSSVRKRPILRMVLLDPGSKRYKRVIDLPLNCLP